MRTWPFAVLLCAMCAHSQTLTNLSAASYKPAAAPSTLMVAFGSSLADTTATAGTLPLPFTLGGVSVTVRDSAGVDRPAALLFVSPGQINYQLPDQLALGPAVVTVHNGAAGVSGPLAIEKTAPGIFTVTADGKGLPAAIALRYTADHREASQFPYRFDSTQQKFVANPIDIGSPTDRIFLSLYGTGIRNASNVGVTIGEVDAPVSYKGPHAVYAGVDQVNVEIPRSLAGRGPLTVQLSADGAKANAVTIDLLGHAYLNLDFETLVRGGILDWGFSDTGYELMSDDSTSSSGSRSLRIRHVSAQAGTVGHAYQYLPIEAVRGRHVRVSCSIRTAAITRGVAALALTVYKSQKQLTSDQTPGVTGTTGWQRYSVERDVSPDASGVVLYPHNTGDGTAWFDNVAVEIDGMPYDPSPAPDTGEPSAARLAWLRRNAVEFATEHPGSGLADLAPLRSIVGNAHIVGLGEGTHGTSEFFRMKHRLLEYLATEMGFTVFAIEANMPEAYRINDYVLTGRGDPKQLLKGMYFWTWDTQEVLDMIEWMRRFNASGRGPLQFTGFDMQHSEVAVRVVRDFVVKHEPAYLLAVDAAYAQVAAATTSSAAEAASAARAVWKHLEQNRAAYSNATAYDIDWAIQNGKIAEQAAYLIVGGASYRDQCMAENFEWILQHAAPDAKTVIWAHNYHVSRTAGTMGSYLAATHDPSYLVVGQLFHEGRYNASGPAGLRDYAAVPSFPGSVEYVFHSSGMPRFLLDVRNTWNEDPDSGWLRNEILFRAIGSAVADGFGVTNRLARDYDLLVFFDQTTPSMLLP